MHSCSWRDGVVPIRVCGAPPVRAEAQPVVGALNFTADHGATRKRNEPMRAPIKKPNRIAVFKTVQCDGLL